MARLPKRERALEHALQRWPSHRALWHARFDALATTGRPTAAIALVRDPRARPLIAPDQPPLPSDLLQAMLTVLDSGNAAARAEMGTRIAAARPMLGTLSAARYLVSLGQADAALLLLKSYYRGSADRSPPGSLSRRHTDILFSPTGGALRSRPGFRGLVDRLGLSGYWQQTGTRPDIAI